ncbi:unnamed protein product, partial [Didymodactylos carnosus]
EHAELELLKFIRFDSLPLGGVQFYWITSGADINRSTFDLGFQIVNHINDEYQLPNKAKMLTNLRNYDTIGKTIHGPKPMYFRPLKEFVPQTF